MNYVLNNLIWIEDLLPPGYEAAAKHGGMAYYIDMKQVLILVEQVEGTHEHKGVMYPFNLWNGCIFPVEFKKQNAFFLKYSFLENHPVNKNWLYIPADSENFEDDVKEFMREIMRSNPLLGIPVKISGPAKAKGEEAEISAPKKKAAPKKIKADKKRENSFILSMTTKRIK